MGRLRAGAETPNVRGLRQGRAAGRQPVRLVVAADQVGPAAGVSGEREGAGTAGGAVSVSLLSAAQRGSAHALSMLIEISP